jgi:hypothetical protein
VTGSPPRLFPDEYSFAISSTAVRKKDDQSKPNARKVHALHPKYLDMAWHYRQHRTSALFSGLNLAIFTLSQLRLQLEADGGNKDAARVLDLRKKSNDVLATVIWGNVGTNVFLTLLSGSVLAGLGAFFFSTVMITLFGRDRPAGLFLAKRFADDGTISAFPDFLTCRVVFCGQTNGGTARLVVGC